MVGNLPLLSKKTNFPIIQKESTNWSNVLSFSFLTVSSISQFQSKTGWNFFLFFTLLFAIILSICYTIFNKI